MYEYKGNYCNFYSPFTDTDTLICPSYQNYIYIVTNESLEAECED